MPRNRWIVIGVGAVLALVVAAIAGNTLGRYYGWTVLFLFWLVRLLTG